MYKMSILDILTTFDESPAIWTARADYWENVAVRHERHNRDDQAGRLRNAVQMMRDRSAKLNRDMVKAERESKRLAKASQSTAIVPVPTRSDRATLVSAMTRSKVTGGFKVRTRVRPSQCPSSEDGPRNPTESDPDPSKVSNAAGNPPRGNSQGKPR